MMSAIRLKTMMIIAVTSRYAMTAYDIAACPSFWTK